MRGYTLIELMVVVSILVCAALVVSSFLSGRREYKRFMEECMGEGHKEIECRIRLSYREVR